MNRIFELNVVPGPPGDDNYCPPPNDAFFPGMRETRDYFWEKLKKSCLMEFFGFEVRRYASC